MKISYSPIEPCLCNLIAAAQKTNNDINKIHPEKIAAASPDNALLQKIYEYSQQVYNEIANSVHSKTLDELYTDKFIPSNPKPGRTTVKLLSTGEPIEVDINSQILEGYSTDTNHVILYSMFAPNGQNLGYKRFGIFVKPEQKLETGRIDSYCNDFVAGTQVRLLQTAIENVFRRGFKQIPLRSAISSVIYHSKMGFRPVESYETKVTCLEDIQKMLLKSKKRFNAYGFTADEITPIISRKGGEYYLDYNRTFYCTAMKHNKNLLKTSHQRNISDSDEPYDYIIDMTLEGKEFEAWLNRIKGFEITSAGEVPMAEEGIFKKIGRYVASALRS